MSVFLKFAAAAAGLVVFAVLALVALTPRDHKVEIVAVYPATPPEEVWALITDHASEPTWLKAFGKVTREADNEGRPVFTHGSADGRMAFTIMTILSVPERRYERILLRDGQPKSQSWDGRWVIDLAPEGAGTRLKFTEYGWTGGFFFFLLQRYYLSPSDFPAYYLKSVGKALGDEAEIDIIRKK